MRFSAAAAVKPSPIRAILTLAEQFPGTLRVFVGEDSLPTPDFIKQAGHRAIDAGKTFYTPNAGYLDVRQAIARHIQDLHGVEVDPATQIIVTAGGMNAIVLTYQATLGPGTSALAITPVWPNLLEGVRVTGADAVEVPLDFSGDGYQLNWDRLEKSVRHDSRLLIIASPGNPTGWTATAEDWERIGEFCERHDLWLMADGAYERIFYAGRAAPTPYAVSKLKKRLIVVQTLSKAYRMTGWRIGYAVAPPEMARIMAGLQEYIVSNAPGIMQETARVAIEAGEPLIAEAQTRYAKHRQICVDRLATIAGVEVPRPTGAFYVFPRLEDLADSMNFCEYLVREHRVGIAPGSAFGKGGEGHVRICFAVEENILREALDRFETGWLAYRAKGETAR